MIRRTENRPVPLLLLLLVAWAGGAIAGGVTAPPAGLRPGVASLAQVARVELAVVDRDRVRQEDLRREEDGEPFRFAESRQVDLSPDSAGSWEMQPDTGRLWRLRLACPGALSLNLGFTEYRLPRGARLMVFAADGTGPALVFDHRDNRDHGQLWTPVLLTDELVVELRLPPGQDGDWLLRLGRVGCGYRLFGEDPGGKSGACNVDVVCPEGDDWRREIATVGVYTVNGYWTCTGVMINNTHEDQRPLFLTAAHCEVEQIDAPTVVVYWNFESPACGQQGGGSLDQFTTGSTLLADFIDSDFALLELAESPDPAFGVNFAGWDRTDTAPAAAVCIHHPSADEKSISFENDQLVITSYSGSDSPGNGTHLQVPDWDLGTTEHGSSGSPLFSAAGKLVVGQLHGGYAACGNDLPDWYGRLSVSWNGGGTADSRLSDWLDPEGTGTLTLPLLDPGDDPIVPPADNANLRLVAMAPNPFLDYMEVTVEVDRDTRASARVYDLVGRLQVDLGTRNLETGENTFAWDGYAPDGSRVPAGVYVLVMEADGRTVRRRFVRMN